MADNEQEVVYLESCVEDGAKVAMYNIDMTFRKYKTREIRDAMLDYEWTDGDVMLCIFTKCGTHMVWEIVQMLLKGNAEYVDLPKESLMIDLIPASLGASSIPSPKALNSHYRLDFLPKPFQNRKTITVLRNVKDCFVSDYFHLEGLWKMIQVQSPPDYTYPTMEQYIDSIIEAKPLRQQGFSDYFSFYEHMLKRRDDNILSLVFEEIVRDPVANVKKINEFLGTNASDEVISQIADATNFQKMKAAKAETERVADSKLLDEDFEKKIDEKERFSLYRKGKIGGWKDYITVAQNERIDAKLKDWIEKNGFQEIPFIYE